MTRQFGIDLGTTNSLIAVFDEGNPRLIANAQGKVLTPSVIGLDDKGTLLVGEAAAAQRLTAPERTVAVFKRNMGTDASHSLGRRQSYDATELSAMILQSLKRDAEAELGEPVEAAVISVPAYFNQVQRKAVSNAARIAGLEVTRLINEPTAAALAYGLADREGESTFLVFDLGGGTFDVSILEMFDGVMEVRSTAGDAFLGGEDFTDALVAWIARENGIERSKADTRTAAFLTEIAEAAKRELTTRHDIRFEREFGDHQIAFTLTRDKFEEINASNIRRLRAPVDRALHDAKLRAGDLDRVVLVGGATRMPLIRNVIARQLQCLPESGIDPDHVVALGAAVQAGLAGKDAALDDVVMTDVSAFTLGIETGREIGGRFHNGFFLPIIERNSVVPISRSEVVGTAERGQASVRVAVYQGEAPMVSDNIHLGDLDVPVPINYDRHEGLDIRFTYDVSGLLEIETTTLSDGKKERLVLSNLAGEMPQSEIDAKLKALAKLKVHPREDARNAATLARLNKCYAMALGQQRVIFQERLAAFEEALSRQNADEIDRMRDELTVMMDRFEAGYVS